MNTVSVTQFRVISITVYVHLQRILLIGRKQQIAGNLNEHKQTRIEQLVFYCCLRYLCCSRLFFPGMIDHILTNL